ncbi:hypothetical protein OS493_033696 [Desmophyllum pertusum]|uniref:Uncharacterized protein n=1 Tax=Desmophyllum pertusum TaxID=174260 RepID=A0A9W9ZJM0_9CNID|nr:hypothetical protein OS493_033696 [Desmophyllum pertusum]
MFPKTYLWSLQSRASPFIVEFTSAGGKGKSVDTLLITSYFVIEQVNGLHNNSDLSRCNLKKTTMGNSNPVWEPGYTPDVHCGAPKVTEDYKDDPKGIQAAYRRANKYVDDNPERTFCTIGPQSWLKCWK